MLAIACLAVLIRFDCHSQTWLRPTGSYSIKSTRLEGIAFYGTTLLHLTSADGYWFGSEAGKVADRDAVFTFVNVKG